MCCCCHPWCFPLPEAVPVIEFRDFSFSYWDAARPALSNVNLRIDQGEFVLLAGRSGCGKTSLCRCLNGLIPHFHGGRFGLGKLH